MDDEQPGDFEPTPRQRGCLLGMALLPVFLAFAFAGHQQRGFVVSVMLGVLIVSLYQTRDAMNENFYVGIVPPLFLAQFLAAIFAPLPDWKFSAPVIMPFAIAATVLNIVVIRTSQRLFGTKG